MKIYRRTRTYVMMLLLVAAVLIISVLWAVFGGTDESMWDVAFIESSVLFVLVTILTVVVAASGVAEEFTSGTIKLLLIRPWSRSKILLSKYIAIILFAVMLAVLLFASTILINWIIFGLIGGTDTASTITNDISNNNDSIFVFMLKYYGLTLLSSIVTVTMAFMLSTLFRSSGLAIGISLFLLLIVKNSVALLLGLDYKWIDYILFIHLDLVQYLVDSPMREGMTLGFSLGVLAAYYIIFMALTFYVFNKRDVAA